MRVSSVLLNLMKLELHSHLRSHLSSKVLVLLLQAFTGLKTDEPADAQFGIVLFRYLRNILRNGLLPVLSLHIYLL